jgi:hypothetical protein
MKATLPSGLVAATTVFGESFLRVTVIERLSFEESAFVRFLPEKATKEGTGKASVSISTKTRHEFGVLK